jgi:hypothetical protein
MARDYQDSKPSWKKQLVSVRFDDSVPCPYCRELQTTSLLLCRHVLSKHNWNKNYQEADATSNPPKDEAKE